MNDHYSYSQLNTYETCPLQYYYRYILGLEGEKTEAIEYGSYIHKQIELYHLGKKNKAPYLYTRKYAWDAFKPEQKVEYVFESIFDDRKLSKPILGFIDRENDEEMGDVKTWSRMRDIEQELQPDFYLYPRWKETGVIKLFKYIILLKEGGKAKSLEELTAVRTELHFQRTFERMWKFEQNLQAEKFNARPSWKCCYCPFKSICNKKRK